MADDTIVRFEEVSFEFSHHKSILDEVSFGIKRGKKITLMGQNGAGKSTLFHLITGDIIPDVGSIHLNPQVTIALARQAIPREQLALTVRDFFAQCFTEKVYDIDPRIDEVLEVVNLSVDHNRIVKSFSGGQQARLLLASALIQNPDLLLLDEPTNNLDKNGIAHLTQFLINYQKTVVVISHDAEFLNAFTHGVLYLDVHSHKIEQYDGDYFNVVEQISARIERENRKNAQLAKKIQDEKDKANYFAYKGGKMRLVAKKMREKAEAMEEEIVDVRKEDKTIRPFTIPVQTDIGGELIRINSYTRIINHTPALRSTNISLRKHDRLLLIGPNGIGKSTLLEAIARRDSKGISIAEGVTIGYYRQDFTTLNFNDTVFESLRAVMDRFDEEKLRATAAHFLITQELMNNTIANLSEGQKGLLSFARLVLQKPGLLILDEPTNHINFRHIPIIAQALDRYEGALILVSHVPDFVKKIKITQTLDLEQ